MAKVLFTSVTLLLLALALGANAAPKEAAQINYDLLYTGSDAPKGAMKNLKKAAELAAKSKDCAVVTSGAWLPSKDQMQNHKGDPWMITCKSQADEYYNVYFSNKDLSRSKEKDQPKPVSLLYAANTCRNAIIQKSPKAKVKFSALESTFNSNRSNGNARFQIPITVENGFGATINRIGTCFITSDGNISSGGVQITPR